jgi:formate-dependent nitrite reductase cytochrome c552 subunit
MNRRTLIRLAAAVCALMWQTSVAVTGEEPESETCALCHEQQTQDWLASPHAQAMDDTFTRVWQQGGKKWECLVCHTSKFDREKGTASHAGISCESCHGAMKEDHTDSDNPNRPKMNLPVTSEVCQSCHTITYGEWRVSAHGQKNIRCFDCHKMHQITLRAGKPDAMCGACHTERLEDFSHATHAVEGLNCLSCHMPEVSGGGMKIRGLGVRGHTFGVGAETCANCHRDMVHASHERASLHEEIVRLKATTPEQQQQRLFDLEHETVRLRDTVTAHRRVFPPVVGLSFVLGVFLGIALPHFRRKKSEGASS